MDPAIDAYYKNTPEDPRWLFARFAPHREKANLSKEYTAPQASSDNDSEVFPRHQNNS